MFCILITFLQLSLQHKKWARALMQKNHKNQANLMLSLRKRTLTLYLPPLQCLRTPTPSANLRESNRRGEKKQPCSCLGSRKVVERRKLSISQHMVSVCLVYVFCNLFIICLSEMIAMWIDFLRSKTFSKLY